MEIGHENGLAVKRRSEYDGGRATETVLDVVGDLAQAPHVRGDDLAGHNPGTVALLGAFDELSALLETPLEGLLPGRLSGILNLSSQPPYGSGKVFYLDPQRLRDLFGRLGGVGQVAERLAAGYHLDAVQVGTVLAVGDDLEGPYLRAAAHMSAAAKLARETVDLDDPHQVGVLLAEKHHRPEIARLLQGGREIPDRLVLGDLLQRDLLHAPDVLLRDLPGIAVVEPEPVGTDVAPRLNDVLPENGPQGPVQDVRGRVVGLDLLATHPVYGGGYRVAGLEGVSLHPGPQDLVVAGRDRVEDLELSFVG